MPWEVSAVSEQRLAFVHAVRTLNLPGGEAGQRPCAAPAAWELERRSKTRSKPATLMSNAMALGGAVRPSGAV